MAQWTDPSSVSRALIPKSFFTLLLSKIDVVELIQQFLPLQKKSSNNYFAKCPFHIEKSASFSVSQAKQFYYCFGCGAHGNAIDFLMHYQHLGFIAAVEMLSDQAGLEVPRKGSTVDASPADNTLGYAALSQLMQKIAIYYQNQLTQSQRAKCYLTERAVDEQVIKQFKLGYAPPQGQHLLTEFGKTPIEREQLLAAGLMIQKGSHYYQSRFRDRIMFPIYNYKGNLVGFGGRVLDQAEPKYMNSPETILFQKKKELYGLYQILNTASVTRRQCLLVEGYMDVIALFQHGMPYAVATLGTATTEYHLKQLQYHTDEMICCFDGDTAGRTAAWRALLTALPLMQDRMQFRFLFLPEGEDPDTLIRKEGKDAFEERCSTAIPLSAFFFETLEQAVDLSTPEGRACCVQNALAHIKLLPETVFQRMLLEELGERLRVDSVLLRQQIKSTRSKGLSKPAIVEDKKERGISETIIQWSTPVRLLMFFLIYQPQLVQWITEPLPNILIPGYSLFLKLVQVIRENSIENRGMLQEYLRGTVIESVQLLVDVEYFNHIDDIKSEFLGALRQLTLLHCNLEVNRLLAEMARGQLSNLEKESLADWLKKKRAILALAR